eukprot:scaffold56514_cov58-Phaeocystis_antarctica.AAC.1
MGGAGSPTLTRPIPGRGRRGWLEEAADLLEQAERDGEAEQYEDARRERGLDILHDRLCQYDGQFVAGDLARGLDRDADTGRDEDAAEEEDAAAEEPLEQLLPLDRDAGQRRLVLWPGRLDLGGVRLRESRTAQHRIQPLPARATLLGRCVEARGRRRVAHRPERRRRRVHHRAVLHRLLPRRLLPVRLLGLRHQHGCGGSPR